MARKRIIFVLFVLLFNSKTKLLESALGALGLPQAGPKCNPLPMDEVLLIETEDFQKALREI